MFIYMKRTKHGYEIAVVGESENTARYAGINVGKVIVRTVGISGGIAGIAAGSHRIREKIIFPRQKACYFAPTVIQ